MTPDIEYNLDSIVIRVRGALASLTPGKWGETSTIDFTRSVVEKVTLRPWRRQVVAYPLSAFTSVDYGYRVLVSGNHRQNDYEEFTVGLRYANKYETLNLATFRGRAPAYENPEWFVKHFPTLAGAGIDHELSSRSLANMLCQKLGMKLAM